MQVLAAFLDQQSGALRALRFLPQFFRWLELLVRSKPPQALEDHRSDCFAVRTTQMEKYSRRLDKKTGRELTVGEFSRQCGRSATPRTLTSPRSDVQARSWPPRQPGRQRSGLLHSLGSRKLGG